MGVLITIDEDIVNSVVKPMSLFLNEIKDGAIFTHIPLKATESAYKIKKDGDKTIYPTFKFASSLGGIYKFTAYDLRNFTFGEQSFADYFIPRPGTMPNLQETFTVSSSKPVLHNGDKVYPLFCYEGYAKFAELRNNLEKGEYPTEEMYEDLKKSGIKESSKDRYYRIIDIDKPIFYFAEK